MNMADKIFDVIVPKEMQIVEKGNQRRKRSFRVMYW